ncbi:MAG: hypothetical protein GX234_10555 [Clostridiales bacterium]|nr:hypothetical protein [Clostridiales bacterium]
MNKNKQYDFCPKCGALMRDGICQSCGYGEGQNEVAQKETVQNIPNGAVPAERILEETVGNGEKKSEEQTGMELKEMQEPDNFYSTNEDGERYYTPLVSPPPSTDWRAIKQQRQQNVQMPYGAQGQPVQNSQMPYGAQGQSVQNSQMPHGTQGQMAQGGGSGMPPYGPGGNQYYNGMPGGMPSGKKNSNAAVIVVCIIAVLASVFIIVAGICLQRYFQKMVDEKEQQGYHEDYDKDYNDDWDHDYDDDHDFDDWDHDYDYDYDFDDWDDEHENDDAYGVTPDALYYKELTDCIDYDVDYDFSYESYAYYDEEDVPDCLEFYVYYVKLKGEQIPNLDDINAQLEYYAKWYVDNYAMELAEEGEECYVSVYAYVTYNDEQKASIVLSETVETEKSYYTGLYPINIDLVNGTILQNSDMIQIDGEFAKEFRKKSIIQNGDDFPDISDEEIYDYLTDEDTLILFYTPVGLEVGINIDDGYYGWITVTYKDYQNLLTLSG